MQVSAHNPQVVQGQLHLASCCFFKSYFAKLYFLMEEKWCPITWTVRTIPLLTLIGWKTGRGGRFVPPWKTLAMVVRVSLSVINHYHTNQARWKPLCLLFEQSISRQLSLWAVPHLAVHLSVLRTSLQRDVLVCALFWQAAQCRETQEGLVCRPSWLEHWFSTL